MAFWQTKTNTAGVRTPRCVINCQLEFKELSRGGSNLIIIMTILHTPTELKQIKQVERNDFLLNRADLTRATTLAFSNFQRAFFV